ncbi:phosphatase PAP2 family protein [uncultured Anaerococcus sp.]|uniref:phosphatase PAP2 family protein n=1 Tax=uncultured Anaerococcus sp. TaxID=293428 RepID=UPI002889B055|nr:phosphatase PAP2 family protein [uncultured Anaerococcus sp.]
MVNFELNILNAIQGMRSTPIDKFMVTISAAGNLSLIWIAFIFIFLSAKELKNQGKIMIIAFILNILLVNILVKNLVARPRPYDVANFTGLLVHKLSDNSFPSGHTSYAFTFATIVTLLNKNKALKIFTDVLAVLMAFSRLYLYVHFPTDVLAGAVFGILIGILSIKIYNSQKYRQIKAKYNLHWA